jgi:hypothetical protein
LNEMAGFAPTEEIQLYEVSFYPILEHCWLFQLVPSAAGKFEGLRLCLALCF